MGAIELLIGSAKDGRRQAIRKSRSRDDGIDLREGEEAIPEDLASSWELGEDGYSYVPIDCAKQGRGNY